MNLDIIEVEHHDVTMRTTLTLDDDVAQKLEAVAKRDGTSFKETVNTLLRRGLASQETRPRRQRRFRVLAFRSAFGAGVDPLRLNQLVDELEVEHASQRIRSNGAR